MLTLDNKYSEFINLVIGKNACTRAVDMIQEVDKSQEGGEILGDGLSKSMAVDLKEQGEKVVNDTSLWCLKTVGKELDVKVRAILLNGITLPATAIKTKFECNYLTVDEYSYLEKIYKDRMDDVNKITICLEAIKKNREFNAVRAEAVNTCKSIKEAKKLLESKTDIKTKISSDDTIKSKNDLKKILETERTSVTIATNLVMKEQGFVDADGNGSPSVFQSWYEGLK